jgi:hypothetical protein
VSAVDRSLQPDPGALTTTARPPHGVGDIVGVLTEMAAADREGDESIGSEARLPS